MKTTTIPTTLDRHGDIETDHVLVTPSGARLGIGAVARDGEGRKVMHGPMVPGPWAFTYPLCTWLDNSGGSGAHYRKLAAAGKLHRVSTGDHVEVDGATYRVRVFREKYIELCAA